MQGEVSRARSHCVIAARSYECPSAHTTGSSMTSCVIGQMHAGQELPRSANHRTMAWCRERCRSAGRGRTARSESVAGEVARAQGEEAGAPVLYEVVGAIGEACFKVT